MKSRWKSEIIVCPTGVGMNRIESFGNGKGYSMPHRRGDEPQEVLNAVARDVYAPQAWG